MFPAKVKCEKCKKYKPCDRHHVTYNPDVIVKICRTCHKKITLVNTIAAVLTKKKMDNILRAVCWLWFKEYKGKITTEAVAGFLKINVVLTQQQERFIKAAKKRMRG